MALSIKASFASSVSCSRQRAGRSRPVVVVKAEKSGEGYIQNDNSGRGNIFPSSAKAYISSPTSTAVASSGLGGPAGVAALAASVVVIGVITAVVANNPTETLQSVVDSYSGDSLSVIAERISASL